LKESSGHSRVLVWRKKKNRSQERIGRAVRLGGGGERVGRAGAKICAFRFLNLSPNNPAQIQARLAAL
jgi:hypothetical protein